MTALSDLAPDPALESLLAFWRDAGLETCVEDGPIDRTVMPEPPRRPGPAPVHAAPALAGLAGEDAGAALAEARRAAAAAQSLEQLAEAIAAFEGCPLRGQGARQAVFARGAPTADVLVVGEAPGAEEDAQGQPFVGRAGKLLDRMLAAAGLAEDVFITNTVFWRPPGNRTPSPAEQLVCAPFVERAIALVRPRVLVLAGGASAKAMLKTDAGILSLRGQWREWRPEAGGEVYPALPILHPAFLLRQPAAKRKAWADLLSLTAKLAELRAAPVDS